MKLTTYLTFNGNCEAALAFYEKALGAKPVILMRYNEAPNGEPTPPEMANKIMHGRLALGDNWLMASDAPPQRYHGNHGFSINISVDSAAEAERLFAALSEKAEVHMPISETFWATRFGMLVDQFGIPWMVNCEKRG